MAQFYNSDYNAQASSSHPQSSAQNLQFYSSSYTNPGHVSGHTTPSQAGYGGYGSSQANAAPGYSGYGTGMSGSGSIPFGNAPVSGRMGEQGGLRTGWLAAFGTEGYDGEPPLLEELGVNFEHIRTKTLTVLNPLTTPSPHIMDDSDLYGALLFLILYGTFLALSGKFFYGYIYGIALFGSLALHLIFSLMTPPLDEQRDHGHPVQSPTGAGSGPGGHNMDGISGGHFSSTLTYSRSASVLGYCFLPLVLTALFGILFSMDTLLGYILTSMAVGWCTFSSSGMFVSVGRMRGMRGLVAYPLALFYVGFGIMGIFSSRVGPAIAVGQAPMAAGGLRGRVS